MKDNQVVILNVFDGGATLVGVVPESIAQTSIHNYVQRRLCTEYFEPRIDSEQVIHLNDDKLYGYNLAWRFPLPCVFFVVASVNAVGRVYQYEAIHKLFVEKVNSKNKEIKK